MRIISRSAGSHGGHDELHSDESRYVAPLANNKVVAIGLGTIGATIPWRMKGA